MARPAESPTSSTNYTVTIEARVGETGRLFGSVTNRDIADKLNAARNGSKSMRNRPSRRAHPRNRPEAGDHQVHPQRHLRSDRRCGTGRSIEARRREVPRREEGPGRSRCEDRRRKEGAAQA
ncbi:MAG: hypothetical protein IPI85_14380 [Dehalococcoidia bacterium]|nr:hypothetical protein [Dehalococcoidia bacterium]